MLTLHNININILRCSFSLTLFLFGTKFIISLVALGNSYITFKNLTDITKCYLKKFQKTIPISNKE